MTPKRHFEINWPLEIIIHANIINQRKLFLILACLIKQVVPRKNQKMSKTVFKKGSCAVVIIVLNCCVNHFTNNLIGPCSISKSIYNHMTRCQRSANNKSTLPEQLLLNQILPGIWLSALYQFWSVLPNLTIFLKLAHLKSHVIWAF